MDEKTKNYKELQKELNESQVKDLINEDTMKQLNEFEKKLLVKWVELFRKQNVNNKKDDEIKFPFMPEKLKIALTRIVIKQRADALKKHKQEFTGGQGGE